MILYKINSIHRLQWNKGKILISKRKEGGRWVRYGSSLVEKLWVVIMMKIVSLGELMKNWAPTRLGQIKTLPFPKADHKIFDKIILEEGAC